jgi:hypothetical protein
MARIVGDLVHRDRVRGDSQITLRYDMPYVRSPVWRQRVQVALRSADIGRSRPIWPWQSGA